MLNIENAIAFLGVTAFFTKGPEMHRLASLEMEWFSMHGREEYEHGHGTLFVDRQHCGLDRSGGLYRFSGPSAVFDGTTLTTPGGFG